ncbi:hypothetical protein CFC21_097091 [Triticum aestivum]|uniref:Uncharacterized protein n=2 Tax=Triticum aestivum TaxID=4565 RepID=A0A9R1MZ58_WHEAT|nr:hypothetical protein CFC21_097091 [Triticum aestivum]
MDAGAPLLRFAALLPCSPAPELPCSASPCCSPARPPPSLPPASRSSPAPLACLPNIPSFTPKIVSSSSRCVPCLRAATTRPPRCPRHRRRHGASNSSSCCAGATSGARGRTRAGRRLNRAPVREGGGRGFRRQGALGMLLESLLLGPLVTSLLKKHNNMTQMRQRTVIQFFHLVKFFHSVMFFHSVKFSQVLLIPPQGKTVCAL